MYYAGKAFLCGAVARWVQEDGLGLDVCTGGELAVALRAGFPGERIALHGNNKSVAELRRALDAGVGRIVIDSLDEIDQVEAVAGRELGVSAVVTLRVTTGVRGPHPLSSSRPPTRTRSSGSRSPAAPPSRPCAEPSRRSTWTSWASTPTSARRSSTRGGFEAAARRVLDLVAQVRTELGHSIDQLDLGGGFGVMYNTQHTPATPSAALAAGIAGIWLDKQCHELELEVPHVSFEPGRAIAGPSTQTLYSVGTVKDVRLGGPHHRVYVSVDGGMSDNVRTALYDADYSCLLTGRAPTPPPRWCVWSASTARAATSWSRA